MLGDNQSKISSTFNRISIFKAKQLYYKSEGFTNILRSSVHSVNDVGIIITRIP